MSQFRLVALLPWIAAAGCYNDAPTQSTFPDQQYVSGPPGGAMDPAPADDPAAGGPGFADEHVAQADPADAPATAQLELLPSEPPPAATTVEPSVAGPAAPSDDDDDDDDSAADVVGSAGIAPVPGVTPGAAPAVAPTASVTDVEIDATLEGYGQWIENDDYGPVWRPDATVVGVDFTPYESGGSWAYTDAGWGFNCDYSWGWLPFHFGRWAWFQDYWGWVPGHRWSPAWVDWRHGGGVIGWRPRPPRVRDHRHGDPRDHRDHREHHHGRGDLVRDHRHAQPHDAHWRFATTSDFARPHIRAHLFRNPAEGLRLTSRASAPPVRARTTVHAGDLMRNRFSGRAGIRQDPRYQAYGPQRPYGATPTARSPSSPDRVYVRPDRPTQPPGRAYQPPGRAYQPPGRAYQPPGRAYQPPGRAYQPPGRAYQPPGRAYQPPARTQPYNPGRPYQPPGRSYQPPPRTFTPSGPSGPPVRTWTPTSRPVMQNAAPPSRSSGPPSSGTRGSSAPSNSGSHDSGGGNHSSGGGNHSSGGGHTSRH